MEALFYRTWKSLGIGYVATYSIMKLTEIADLGAYNFHDSRLDFLEKVS